MSESEDYQEVTLRNVKSWMPDIAKFFTGLRGRRVGSTPPETWTYAGRVLQQEFYMHQSWAAPSNYSSGPVCACSNVHVAACVVKWAS